MLLLYRFVLRSVTSTYCCHHLLCLFIFNTSSNLVQLWTGADRVRETTQSAVTRFWRWCGKLTLNFISLFLLFNYFIYWFSKLRDSSPPLQVLARCQDLCLRDRTAANNLVRTCSSFDFQPGKRLTMPTALTATSLGSLSSASAAGIEYEESICYLSREQGRPEGLGTLVNMPGHFLYSEVCLSCK